MKQSFAHLWRVLLVEVGGSSWSASKISKECCRDGFTTLVRVLLSTDASGAWLTVNLLVKELVDWLLFAEKLTLLFVASIFTHGKIHGKSGHVKSLLPEVLS